MLIFNNFSYLLNPIVLDFQKSIRMKDKLYTPDSSDNFNSFYQILQNSCVSNKFYYHTLRYVFLGY